MSLEITIDWLSVTFKGVSQNEKAWIDKYSPREVYDATLALNSYDCASRAETGVVHMWSSTREEMGHHYQFVGSTLRNIFRNGDIQQETLVSDTVHAGGRITRIDLAKDEKWTPVNYDEIWTELLARRYTGTTRKPTRHQSENGGYTIYLGSWKSDKFARIYNKASEQAVQGTWNRYELVIKSEYARNMAKYIASNGSLVAAFDTMTKGMVSLDNSGLLQMFYDNETITVSLPKLEKVTDTEKWITSQVMPALAKHYEQHLDSEAIELLLRVLDFIRSRGQ